MPGLRADQGVQVAARTADDREIGSAEPASRSYSVAAETP